jgi:hypothetical protein
MSRIGPRSYGGFLQKTKTFWRTKFDAKTLTAADEVFGTLSWQKRLYRTLEVTLSDSVWTFDTLPQPSNSPRSTRFM